MALTENPTLVQIVDEIERLNNLVIDRGGARTITPSTYNQILSKGNYKGNITVSGDNNLLAENIKQGVNIFGINGTFAGGIKWAEGSVSASEFKSFNTLTGYSELFYYVSLSNLGFYPKCVICVSPNTSQESVSLLCLTSMTVTGGEAGKCVSFFKRNRATFNNSVCSVRIDSVVNIGDGTYHIPVSATGTYMWIAYE